MTKKYCGTITSVRGIDYKVFLDQIPTNGRMLFWVSDLSDKDEALRNEGEAMALDETSALRVAKDMVNSKVF